MVRRVRREAGACAVGGFIANTPVELGLLNPMMKCVERRGGFGSGRAYVPLTDGTVENQVNRLADHRIATTHENVTFEAMLADPSVVSWSSRVVCEKAIVGFGELGRITGTDENKVVVSAVGHVRFPTGSDPTDKRAHPFAMGELGKVDGMACVINGDDVAGSPKIYEAKRRIAKILHEKGESDDRIETLLEMFESRLTGSDSEKISWLVFALLADGETFDRVAKLLTNTSNPFSLQGPYTGLCVVSIKEGEATKPYLYGFSDRDGYRPLVCGELNDIRFMGSEEQQMPDGARVWRPRAGRFVLADRDGWLEKGDRIIVPVTKHDSQILKDREGFFGFEDLRGEIAQDDVGSKMSARRDAEGNKMGPDPNVIVTHYVGRRFANAFDGRYAYVGGNLGPYGFIQFRNPKAIGICEGGADRHLGFMASGGEMFILRKGDEDVEANAGSGIVGNAKIMVRGILEPWKIGREYDKELAKILFSTLLKNGKIDKTEYDDAEALRFNPWITSVNPEATDMIAKVFQTSYPITTEIRELTDEEKLAVRGFYTEKNIKPPDNLETLLADRYTVIVSSMKTD